MSWYDNSWNNRVKVTVDHTKVPNTDQTNFPVFADLSLLPTDFFTKVRSDGADIRVTTSDGVTECPIELVAIDTSGKTGELHFQAPTLSHTGDSDFLIYCNYTETYSHSLSLVGASSQGVSIPDASVLKPTGSFAVEVWFNTTSAAAEQDIFQSESENTNVAGIKIFMTSGKLNFLSGKNTGTTSNTDYKNIQAPNAYNDGIDHHAVFTWDGSTMYIIVDGVQATSAAWANAPGYAATNYVRIGCGNTTGTNFAFFTGNLMAVRFHSTSKTASQAQSLMFMDKTTAGNLANVIAIWNLDNDYTDSKAGNNGSAIGSPTFSTTIRSLKYAKAAAYGSQNVWDSHFLAVWHLSDVNDSTANARNLTNNNSVSFVSSLVGKGADLGSANTNKWLSLASNMGLGGGAFSVSGIVKLKSEIASSTWGIFGLDTSTNNIDIIMHYDYNSGSQQLIYDRDQIGVAAGNITRAGALGTTNYNHLAFTYDASTERALFNGSQVGSLASTGSGSSSNGNGFGIGARVDAGSGFSTPNFYASALFDEVRVSDTQRSNDWEATESNNLTSNSTFLSIGSLQSKISGALFFSQL